MLITLAASLQGALPAHGQCDPSQVGVPASLAVATQPWISSASGVGLIQQPAVQVRDACGDPVLQAGIGVTASLASGTGTLGGTTTATTDSSGIATFTNLFITGAEGEYTIGFASSGLTGVTTHAISLVDSCELFVQETFLQNGVDGQVNALATLNGKLYVGGWFTTAGEARANYVAAWDPATSTWSSLGTGIANGVDNGVYALAALDGKLYVGGWFTTAGGLPANHVAAWDPATSTWSRLGTLIENGVDDDVLALAALDGKLYVGGYFSTAGGSVTANAVAAWEPATSTWSRLGTRSENGIDWTSISSGVLALTALDGKLYVGGNFTSVGGGVTANSVAVWEPATSTWSSLGTGSANGVSGGGGYGGTYVNALAALDGKLYVGGDFTTAGGATANNVAAWDPATSTWSSLGTGSANGVNGEVNALAALDGKLYVGGEFTTAGGATANYVAVWDPTTSTWSSLGSGSANGVDGGIQVNTAVMALAALDGKLYVGGDFITAGGATAINVADWETATSTWSSFGTGIANGVDDEVNALAALDGTLYVGGDFTTAGGLPANRVAVWDPTTSTWSSLGMGSANGVGGGGNSVYALAALDGTLYVGGDFTTAGGATANYVAAWDPATSTWSSLGTGSANGVDDEVNALAALDGKLYVGGWFTTAGGATAKGVAVWDPTTSAWSSLETGSANGVGSGGISALAALDGKLYVGGQFTTAGGATARNVAVWDPTTSTWSSLGMLIENGVGGTVDALAALDGKLYVGGWFTTAAARRRTMSRCGTPRRARGRAWGRGARTGSSFMSTPSPRSTANSTSAAASPPRAAFRQTMSRSGTLRRARGRGSGR